MKIDPSVEARQVESLQAFKKARNAAAVSAALDKVRAGAKGKENLMPLFLEAVKAETTMGEISDALRDVFGEYKETVVL
ncbi:MAG: methylmalonyl-CoA mutase family protein [Anaeromyxobacter sp.]